MSKTAVKQNIRETYVKELMHEGCITISSGATLSQAIDKMRNAGVSSLVTEPRWEGDAYGIVTRRDILNKAFVAGPRRENFSETKVYEVMTKPFISVTPGLKAKYAARLMKRHDVHRLPVLEGSKVVGMVSDSDIFKRL